MLVPNVLMLDQTNTSGTSNNYKGKAIIHNSDYQSVEDCKLAIDLYFKERNQAFIENPKRAGKKIWGEEIVKPIFKESNNCKDPNRR